MHLHCLYIYINIFILILEIHIFHSVITCWNITKSISNTEPENMVEEETFY